MKGENPRFHDYKFQMECRNDHHSRRSYAVHSFGGSLSARSHTLVCDMRMWPESEVCVIEEIAMWG